MATTFGENLRRVRLRKRLTQEALMSRMGLKRPAPISLWESRSAVPRPATIERLARALGCHPRELLEGVETPYDRLKAGRSLVEPDEALLERPSDRRRRAGSA